MSRFVFWPLDAAAEEEAAWLRAQAAGLTLLRAGWRLAGLMAKANFIPAEARIPAGSAGGGRWTDAGGGTGYVRVAANDRSGIATDASPIADRAPSAVDLFQEEQNGGHTISEHVGKNSAYLMDRVNQTLQVDTPFGSYELVPERAGSFPSVQAAQKLINSTLSQNPLTVSMVANGLLPKELVTATFPSKTGIEAFRPSSTAQPYIRDTYGVGVVIQFDPKSSKGFRVLTAYPRGDR